MCSMTSPSLHVAVLLMVPAVQRLPQPHLISQEGDPQGWFPVCRQGCGRSSISQQRWGHPGDCIMHSRSSCAPRTRRCPADQTPPGLPAAVGSVHPALSRAGQVHTSTHPDHSPTVRGHTHSPSAGTALGLRALKTCVWACSSGRLREVGSEPRWSERAPGLDHNARGQRPECRVTEGACAERHRGGRAAVLRAWCSPATRLHGDAVSPRQQE